MAGKKALVIKPERLMALLNYFESRVEVWPLYFSHEPLVEFEIREDGAHLRVLVQNESMYQKAFEYSEAVGFSEFPTFEDFKEIFYKSGIWGYANWDEFLAEVKEAEKSDHIYRGEPVVFFAFDTNLHYHRFYTLTFETITNRPGTPIPVTKYGFVWTKGVKKELLDQKVINKLKKSDVDRLLSFCICEDKHEFRQIWLNAYNKKSRERLLAYADFTKGCKKYPNLIESERGDAEFVEALKRFREGNKRIVIVSRDKDLQLYASNESNVRAIRLVTDKPKSWTEMIIPPECLPQFLYVMSVYYGCIQLDANEGCVSLFGFWGSQDGREIMEELAKVQVKDDEPTFWDDFCRDMEIIDSLER